MLPVAETETVGGGAAAAEEDGEAEEEEEGEDGEDFDGGEIGSGFAVSVDEENVEGEGVRRRGVI